MDAREVAEIVREADSFGFADGVDRAAYILDRGVTVGEYRRYERRKTARVAVLCLISLLLLWAAVGEIVRHAKAGRPPAVNGQGGR